MRERGLPCTEESVRGILAGRKTQTRRLVMGAPVDAGFATFTAHHDRPGGSALFFAGPTVYSCGLGTIRCPYGAPGDRLWVRETWGLRAPFDFTDWHRGSVAGLAELPPDLEIDYRADWQQSHEPCFWRPSIHMPRWASRITLEVTGVRVERLQSITEEDARAEGAVPYTTNTLRMGGGSESGPLFRRSFEENWDSINGHRAPWASNPWVWVVEFRRVEAAREAA